MMLSNALPRAAAEVTELDWETVQTWFQQAFFSGGEIPNTQREAEKLSPIAAAHRLLTGSMSLIPFSLYQRRDGGRYPYEDADINFLLRVRANQRMSPALCRKVLMSQAFWHGTGYGWMVRAPNGVITEIVPLPSDQVTIRRDNYTGNSWYDCVLETGESRTFAPSELIIVFFDTYDGLHGRGLLSLARETIGADGAAQRFARKFYQNGACTSGIVEVEADLGKPGRDHIKGEFGRYASGGDDAFKVAVLDRGMKFTPMGLNQSDAQFIESRNFSVAEVARFTGVPEFMLQAGKQAYSSNEQQQLSFLINTVASHVTLWEQEWGYKLLGRQLMKDKSVYLRGNVDAMLRGDFKTRAEGYEKMISYAVYTPDDCRAKEEMNPYPNGQGARPLATKNLASLDQVLAGTAAEGGK